MFAVGGGALLKRLSGQPVVARPQGHRRVKYDAIGAGSKVNDAGSGKGVAVELVARHVAAGVGIDLHHRWSTPAPCTPTYWPSTVAVTTFQKTLLGTTKSSAAWLLRYPYSCPCDLP